MNILLILPQFLYSFLKKDHNCCENDLSIKIKASSIKEMFLFLKSSQPEVCRHIFDENGKIKRNIIFVMDDTLISRDELDNIRFNNHSIVELMFQFAGG